LEQNDFFDYYEELDGSEEEFGSDEEVNNSKFEHCQ